jgi:hypothetical protein
MKTSRFALFAFAAMLGIGSLVGSTQTSQAGSLDWLGNKDYVNCLKLMDGMSRGGAVWGSPNRSGTEREAAYDRGRRFCNRKFYPGRPGYDY